MFPNFAPAQRMRSQFYSVGRRERKEQEPWLAGGASQLFVEFVFFSCCSGTP